MKVAFDIDGCLIHQEGTGEEPDTPRYDVISLLHLLKKLGCEIYIWSGGGIDYAETWQRRLGLMDCTVIMKGSTMPDIAIDDEEVTLGRINIKV